jgi:hypothetical protein
MVLGIDVTAEVIGLWRTWLMPRTQPFRIPRELAVVRNWTDDRDRLTVESLDAFELYQTPRSEAVVWLTREQAGSLPRQVRRSQPTPHRWPTASEERDTSIAVRYVERGRRPSRHREVAQEQWASCEELLPGARDLAGTFARHSGPNCFGTVMAAAGVPGSVDEWMQREPFEAWLADSTRPGGEDERPGTVLVWRDGEGQTAHAAITLGGGWLLHKPSQGWMLPRQVLSVQDGKYSARHPGLKLSRRRIIG